MNTLTAELIVNKAVTLTATLPADLLLTYIRDLLRWNPQLGLVSRRDPLAACERLILESAELLLRVKETASGRLRCVDVGSGGGFPGLVWALAEPAWAFLLVERKLGRAAFLQAEALRLGLSRVETLADSIETARAHERFVQAFDVGVALAVGAPAEIGPWVEHLLVPGGRFVGTVSEDANPPVRVGKTLDLESRKAGHYGNFVFYRRGA